VRRRRIELVWPRGRAGLPRRLTVGWGRVLLGLAVGGLVLAGVGLLGGVTLSRTQERREHALLRSRIASLQAQAAELTGQLAQLEREGARLRVSAGLEPLHEDVLRVGVGGGQYVPPRSETDFVGDRLDKLGRVVGLLKSSFAQLEHNLDERKEKWSRVPCTHPVPGSLVMSRFGMRTHPVLGVWAMHEGADFGARTGTPVAVTADGMVKFSGWKPGFGYTVKVDHGGEYTTVYSHNSKNKVRKGDRVRRGDVIALLGSTGLSTGPHLHYEVRANNIPKDPLQYILPDVVVD
jgi:murein DD-endopeptidase MepM/ murein hydrolase activator NlpD